jgi:hypothetical protein
MDAGFFKWLRANPRKPRIRIHFLVGMMDEKGAFMSYADTYWRDNIERLPRIGEYVNFTQEGMLVYGEVKWIVHNYTENFIRIAIKTNRT